MLSAPSLKPSETMRVKLRPLIRSRNYCYFLTKNLYRHYVCWHNYFGKFDHSGPGTLPEIAMPTYVMPRQLPIENVYKNTETGSHL